MRILLPTSKGYIFFHMIIVLAGGEKIHTKGNWSRGEDNTFHSNYGSYYARICAMLSVNFLHLQFY